MGRKPHGNEDPKNLKEEFVVQTAGMKATVGPLWWGIQRQRDS